jgi:hypothetical protein
LNKEINAARLILRNSKIFCETIDKPFTNLDGKGKIEPEFLNCVLQCESNRIEYYMSHVNHKKPCLHNVIKYESDRFNCMNTNTISDIRKAIFERLESLSAYRHEYYEDLMRNCKKDELCQILEMAEEEIMGNEEFGNPDYFDSEHDDW